MTFAPATIALRAQHRARVMTETRAPARLRVARATRQLERVVEFYRDGLGFAIVDRFENHAGYSGVILALPGGAQLEITQHARGRAQAAPDTDDLLVLYLPSRAHLGRLSRRLERLGHVCVQPANPYWLDKGLTFEDPDRWRVVLCDESSL